MNELIATIKRVIRYWGLFELLLTCIFFPFSLLYIGLRIVQEWGER
jgi:hypothetical protein